MKIAIIGAGVSGLSLAYYLRKFSKQEIEITIYEKNNRVGGNALTQELNLTSLKRPDTWVDLGVNDFNINTYSAMLSLWHEIQLPQDQYVGTLENETSFFYYNASSNDSCGFKISNNGDIEAHNIQTETVNKIKQGFINFEQYLKEWYTNKDKDPSAFTITVKQFIEKYFKDKSDPFVKMALLPRINAMYFSYEESPVKQSPVLDMPMWLVSHYYVLQEGLALDPNRKGKDKERKFFKQGSQKWLEFLAQKLTEEYQVNILYGVYGIKVCRCEQGEGAYVYYNDGLSGYYDKVVFCTPAYEVKNITDPATFASDELLQKTKEFSYKHCIVSVNHDPCQVPLSDFICAYNVRIYDYESDALTSEQVRDPALCTPNGGIYAPYHMTYSGNKHQPQSDYENASDFYISVNPLNMDSEQFRKHRLYQTNGALAQAEFMHCNFTPQALNAQRDIQLAQIGTWNPQQNYGELGLDQVQRTFYLAGNYCNGAGLHTECILFSKDLAQKIVEPSFVSDNFYDLQRITQRHPAPAYMRNVLNIS